MQLILRIVKGDFHLAGKSRRRRLILPLIRSQQPGTLEIDNARIYEIIPFP
jgi:hypothetical protein